MKPTENIGFLLAHINASLTRRYEDILQESAGIGYSQYKILMVLKWHPGIQQKQIAKRLSQTEASISRQVKLMYQDGLLQAVRRPEDRREHITTLTVRGERICQQAIKLLNGIQFSVLNHLDPVQEEQLKELLQQLYEGINNSKSNNQKEI